MIYDTLNNLPNYLGVSDNLDTVIEYIMARDITTLPAGRTRIDGDKAVVTVSTVTPQTSDKALFQRHDNHITLETDLDGSELFEVSLAELTPTKDSSIRTGYWSFCFICLEKGDAREDSNSNSDDRWEPRPGLLFCAARDIRTHA